MGDAPAGHCLFDEPWWLEAVAPGRWGEVEYRSGGSLLGRLPYVRQEAQFGWPQLAMAACTPTLGPWISDAGNRGGGQLTHEMEVMAALIERLPPHDAFAQTFHHNITNWLPFYWRGYSQTTRYTYLLRDLSDPEKLWNGVRSKVRREIRDARKQISVHTTEDVDHVWKIIGLTFERLGQAHPYPLETFRRLDAAAAARGSRTAYIAQDESGRIHAAVYVVHDKRSAYYIAGGADPSLRASGAHRLLLWEAIEGAARTSAEFNFEGSMIEPVERVFRGFGAEQVPLLRVSYQSQRLALARTGAGVLRGVKDRVGTLTSRLSPGRMK